MDELDTKAEAVRVAFSNAEQAVDVLARAVEAHGTDSEAVSEFEGACNDLLWKAYQKTVDLYEKARASMTT